MNMNYKFETLQASLLPGSSTAVLESPSTETSNGNGPRLPLNESFARLCSSRPKKQSHQKRRSPKAKSLSVLRGESLYNHFHALLETHLSNQRTSRILEVNCGSGKFCHTLVERGYQTYGVDQSHLLLQQAREIAPGCVFERAAVYESFRDLFQQQFEAIIYLESIEHLVSPQRFIQTAVESLAPGGLLIVSARYQGYLLNLTTALGRHITDTGNQPDTLTSRVDRSPITLKMLVKDSGLRLVEFQGQKSMARFRRSQLVVARKPGIRLRSVE